MEQMNLQIISPRWLIPVEPEGVVLDHHSVVVEGPRIRALLPAEVARREYPTAHETRLDGHVLVPGFVNLHAHSGMSLMRGLADDLPLMTWLQEHIWPAEGALLSESYVYDGTLLAGAEMIRSGTTCFADMYFYHHVAARAARTLGLRAAVGAAILEFPTPYAANAEEYLAKALAVRDEIDGDACLKMMLTPHAPYTVADDTFRRVVTIAEEAEFPIMVHLHETAGEVADELQKTGTRSVARLDRLGVLGPQMIGVHCVHLTPEEVSLFAHRGVHVAHCPVSNLKLASGIAPVKALLEAGVNVGIGTDGAASNNRLDMISESRIAALLQKGASGDAAAVPVHQLLRMATLHGARALGWDQEIGSLRAGKSADMAAIDLSGIETQPVYDPASHIFNAAGRECVTHVWVQGEALLTDRKLQRWSEVEAVELAHRWQPRFAATQNPS
ncbi:MAG: TRZ/ATZ family hydrolase [Betaproteobacteria bacterium]|nr:TRZ/ATZ family hydrolase [Betaproteobacteria bacterium]